MGLNLRLKALSVGVGLALPMFGHALMISPVKLDSSQGEPLYAEIPFSNATGEQALQVSLANGDDLIEIGANQSVDASSTFNTFVRQSGNGNGVIVITSNKPIQTDHVNLVVKINDNGQTRMQQVNARLPSRIDRLKAQLDDTTNQPKKIANKDATVNLPVVKDNTPNKKDEKPLILNNEPPPAINGITLTNDTPIADPNNNAQAIEMAKMRQANANKTTKNDDVVVTPAKTGATPPTSAKNNAKNNTQNGAKKQSKAPPAQGESAPANYVVKNKDSLWSIAAQIAQQQNEDPSKVMKAIQQQNPNAFPNGNPNVLMQGTILTLPGQYQVINPKKLKPEPKANEQTQAKAPVKAPQPAKPEQQAKAPTPQPKPIAKPQQPKIAVAEKPTPPQNEAHMSVVGSSQQGNLQGGNKLSSAETKALQTLVTQIQTQRTLTLSLQNQVRQLDQTVKAKAQRIQVLNSRLAELEKQLQAKKGVPAQPNKQK